MFDCHQTTALASEYLEGRLSWWSRIRYRMHLFICNRCTKFLRQLRATLAALARLEPAAPADEERAALIARFGARRSG